MHPALVISACQSPGMLAPAPDSGGTPQPNFANVVLLVGFNSEAGGTVDDESNSNHTVSLVDGATIDASVKKFGAGSLLITVGTERCTVPDSDNWHFGAGAFTVEGWFRWSSYEAGLAYTIFSQSVSTGNQRTWDLSWKTNSELDLRVSSNGVGISSMAASGVLPAPTVGQWYHIAADFDGTTYRIYLDGVMVASGGSPIAAFNGTGVLRIGGIPPTAPSASFIGNIDEVRITKGEAVYASDSGFTVPSEAFPRS